MTASVSLQVRADPAGLAALQERAAAWLEASGVGFVASQRILLALDELAANVHDHGAQPGTAPAAIQVTFARVMGAIALEFSDDGPAFDPATAPAVAPIARLEDAPIGGFGLHLVRRLALSFEYRRDGARNRLRLRFADHADAQADATAPPAP